MDAIFSRVLVGTCTLLVGALAGCQPDTCRQISADRVVCEVDGRSHTYAGGVGKADASFAAGTCIQGDANDDERVDIFDLASVAGALDSADTEADRNGDGAVDERDLDLVGQRYGCAYEAELSSDVWVLAGDVTRRVLAGGQWSEVSICVDTNDYPNGTHHPYAVVDGAWHELAVGDCRRFVGQRIEVRRPAVAGSSSGSFDKRTEARRGDLTPWELEGSVLSVQLASLPPTGQPAWLRVCTDDLGHLENPTHHPYLEVDGAVLVLRSSECIEVEGHQVTVKRNDNTGPSTGTYQQLQW